MTIKPASLSLVAKFLACSSLIALGALPATALAWAWTSTEQYGNWTDSEGWDLNNDVWGAAGGWQQTISADSHSYFEVTGNLSAQQYIASYPHASKDVNRPVNDVANLVKPLMAAFNCSIPTNVDFDFAFDLWANGTDYEVMIWNNWNGVNPIAASYNATGPVATWSNVTIDGAVYNVYTGVGGSGPHCISFLPTAGKRNSATLNLSAFLKWIGDRGYWNNPTLTSVQLGWEIVSTRGVSKTFTMNSFALTYGDGPFVDPAPVFPFFLNVGGAASGNYLVDAYFLGGTPATTTASIDTSRLTANVPQSVLQSERYGAMTYSFAGVPAGNYTVSLFMVEAFFTSAGQRKFNAAINGAAVLSNFDVFANAGGKNNAIQRDFRVAVGADGKIVIVFTNGAADFPKIDAIAITRSGVSADLNSDGHTELLWENTANGQRFAWLMNGTAFTSGVDLGTLSTEWHIAGTGDFNGDGKSDLVWENTTTGDCYVWLMNGTSWSSSVYLGNLPTAWRIAGTGDFNADGKTDLVWENSTTGDRYLWLMNGTGWASSVYLGNLSSQWRIVGTGDFNADGKTDLVWENTTTGDRYIWLMNGTAYSSSAYIGNVAVVWHIAGAGDYNSDGQPDIVWENSTTGERGMWLMAGTSYSSWVSLGIVPTQWRIRN